MSEWALLADEIAITRVIAEYSRAADRCDQAALTGVYHDDGVDEHGSHFVGLGSEFAAWAASQRDVFTAGVHHVTTVRMDVVGDAAAVESTTFGLVRLDTGRVSWSSGRYLDRVERRDGEWKIAYRRFVHDIGLPVPSKPASGSIDANTATGARSPADPSYALFAALRNATTWPSAEASTR